MSFERTLLYKAIQIGWVSLVKKLVEDGYKLNEADSDKRHALHYAVQSGNKEIVNYI